MNKSNILVGNQTGFNNQVFEEVSEQFNTGDKILVKFKNGSEVIIRPCDIKKTARGCKGKKLGKKDLEVESVEVLNE